MRIEEIDKNFKPISFCGKEDVVFVDKVLKKCEKIVYGNRILYLYYQNIDSITHKSDISQMKKSWKYNVEYFYEGSLKEFPDLVEAARCKQFLMALDFGCRIWGIDKEFEYELLKFIKKVAWRVLCNSENKTFHRILAFLSCISIRGTVYICRLYNRLKFMLKIQQKKAV